MGRAGRGLFCIPSKWGAREDSWKPKSDQVLSELVLSVSVDWETPRGGRGASAQSSLSERTSSQLNRTGGKGQSDHQTLDVDLCFRHLLSVQLRATPLMAEKCQLHIKIGAVFSRHHFFDRSASKLDQLLHAVSDPEISGTEGSAKGPWQLGESK